MKRWAIIGAAGAMLLSNVAAQSAPPYPRVDVSIEDGYSRPDGRMDSGLILTNATTFVVGFAVYTQDGQWEADGDLDTDGGSLSFGCATGTYVIHWYYEQTKSDDTSTVTVMPEHATHIVVSWGK